jgi:hypothetical protein
MAEKSGKNGTVNFRVKEKTNAGSPTVKDPLPGITTYNPYGRNKLCCIQNFTTDTPSKYVVTVYGRTADVIFSYESNEFVMNPAIPVIGLFATINTTVIFEIIDNTGNSSQFVAEYERRDIWDDFTGHVLQVAFNVLDQNMAGSTINNGWFFNGYYIDAYDKNGDIRVCGLSEIVEPNMPMKIHDNHIIIPDLPTGGYYYTARYLKLNIMGEIVGTYTVPDGYGYHHDLTWDNDGNVYFLISRNDGVDADHFLESIIYKMKDATGEFMASFDYSEIYHDFEAIVYSDPFDAHFNSLIYVPTLDQLIVNSRNSSSYFGVDKNTLRPLWTVQEAGTKPLFRDRTLTVVNPIDYVFINGAHTVFETHNPAYDAYRGPGKVVLMIFDNVACVDQQGNGIYVPTADAKSQNLGYPWDSAVQIVAIDLNNNTVEQLARFTVPGERSVITSSVYDSDDNKYFQVYFGVPTDFYVIDTRGSVGLSAKKMRPDLDFPIEYRARVFSMNDIIATLGI